MKKPNSTATDLLPNNEYLRDKQPSVSYQKKASTTAGSCTIYAIIRYAGKPSNPFSTGQNGLVKDWHAASKRFLGKRYTTENDMLTRIETDIYAIYRELRNNKQPITAQVLKDIYTSQDKAITVTALRELYMQYVGSLEGKQYGKRMVMKRDSDTKLLIQFLENTEQTGLLIRNVNRKFFYDFLYFLQQKGLKNSYIRKIFFTVKSLFEFGVNQNYLVRSPYELPKGIKKGTDEPLRYLNEQELHNLKHYQADTPKLQKAADLFIFQCYTGFCYADAMTFDIRLDTQVQPNKTVWIVKERQKTGTLTRLPLFPEAYFILEKYGFKLPYLHNAKYNKALKEVAKALKINTKLTTHVARKTAGFLWLNNGLDYKTVSQMLGHKSVLITEKHYARVLLNTIEKSIQEANIYNFIENQQLQTALLLLNQTNTSNEKTTQKTSENENNSENPKQEILYS
jgi:integrase/recombinase XerD